MNAPTNIHGFILLGVQLFSLSVLAVFGMHRLLLLIRYFRVRDGAPIRPTSPTPLPRVTIQLPVYNESAVIERLLTAVSLIDYPQELFEVQVLDDSNDETSELIRRKVHSLQREGLQIRHLQRPNRAGYKAGALSFGLEAASGELIAVFDADFIPGPRFLLDTVPYFTDPAISMVQLRWDHLNSGASLLTRAQTVLLDGHFQLEHTARARSGLFFNFNGTAGIWRAEAIHQAGGWQCDTLTEDLDLSYRAQLGGARFLYLWEQAVPAELPSQLSAFKTQQYRWTKGSVEVLRKLSGQLWHAPLPLRQKAEAFFHLGANLCYPLMLLVGLLILPTLELQYEIVQSSDLFVSRLYRAAISGAFLSVLLFYIAAVYETRHATLLHALWQAPLAIITGLALSLSNSLAVIEALRGHRSPFVRTEKTGELRLKDIMRRHSGGPMRKAGSRPKLLLCELGLFLYFSFTWFRILELGRWALLPFATLFLAAFGLFSLIGLLDVLRLLSADAARPRRLILDEEAESQLRS